MHSTNQEVSQSLSTAWKNALADTACCIARTILVLVPKPENVLPILVGVGVVVGAHEPKYPHYTGLFLLGMGSALLAKVMPSAVVPILGTVLVMSRVPAKK